MSQRTPTSDGIPWGPAATIAFTPPQMEVHEPLYPYQYELLWALLRHGPMTAAELLDRQRSPRPSWARWKRPQDVSSRLRPLVQRGWLTRDPVTRCYYPTTRARLAVSW